MSEIRWSARSDSVLSNVLNFTLQGWPDNISSKLIPFKNRATELTVESDCLLWGHRVVIRSELQGKVLKELHDTHPGISRMKALARSYVWWPQLDKEIETLAKSCDVCLTVKQSLPTAPLHPWIWPAKPWTRIHVDFAGPLGKMFFVVVDAHSKWPEVFDMKSTTAQYMIEILRSLFSS